MKHVVLIFIFLLHANIFSGGAVYLQENAAPSLARFHPYFVYTLHNWKLCAGTDSDFSEKDFVDDSFPILPYLSKTDSDSSILWFRKNILFSKKPNATDIISRMAVGLPGAYEVYRDGRLIGSNGSFPQHSGEYESGRIVNYFKLNFTTGHFFVDTDYADKH